MTSNENNLRERVYKFVNLHADKAKSFIVRHFVEEGVPKRTIYDILKRLENGLPAARKVGSGRTPKIFTPAKVAKLKKAFENNDHLSIRAAARFFKASRSWTHEVLQKKTNIKCHKKKTVPDRTEAQIALAKIKCGRLLRKFSDRSFILDDESYFTFSNSTISGNDIFYSSNVSTASVDVKYKKKKKFQQKVLVWLAIGPEGLSKPLFTPSGMAITADIYINQCLKKRLIPYIKSKYILGSYIFWPDQASAHYAKKVQKFLMEENIEEDNPANTPEIRVFEDF